MPVPTPKGPQDAVTQARVLERANDIAEQLKVGGNYYVYQSQPNEIYFMVKRNGVKPDTTYTLDLLNETCTCPFHIENHYCKHILALQIGLEREADEAQCEQHDFDMLHCENEVTGCEYPY